MRYWAFTDCMHTEQNNKKKIINSKKKKKGQKVTGSQQRNKH